MGEYDGRTFKHETIKELAKRKNSGYYGLLILNTLQILAEFYDNMGNKRRIKNLKIAFVGDGATM